jgi:hypothetical protein
MNIRWLKIVIEQERAKPLYYFNVNKILFSECSNTMQELINRSFTGEVQDTFLVDADKHRYALK